MLVSMLKIEHLKLYRRKALWIELALLAGLIVLMLGFITVVTSAAELPAVETMMLQGMVLWPNGVNTALMLASPQALGALLTIVLVSLVVAQEYGWQSHSLAVRAGVPRMTVIAAKFITLFGAALLMTLLALTVGVITSALLTNAIDGSFALADVNVADLLVSAARTGYTLLPYLALSFLISVVTRSLAASIAFAAGYAFLVEGIVSQVFALFGGVAAQITAHLPGSLATALNSLNGGAAAMASDAAGASVDPAVAAVLIAVYTIVLTAAAFIIFRRQDLAS